MTVYCQYPSHSSQASIFTASNPIGPVKALPSIKLKRAYDPPARGDGLRVLVDRLWPRGVKEDLGLDAWAKELAPSTELRKWFGHDPERWAEFQKRYRAELKKAGAAEVIRNLLAGKRVNTITLLYGAKDREHNEAAVLHDFLEGNMS